MRIVVWNCCRGPIERKLEYLRTLEPDIAVLPECPRPNGALDHERVRWTGDRPELGLAVIAAGEYRLGADTAVAAVPHSLAVEVNGPVSFGLLALWTQRRPTYVTHALAAVEAYDGFLRQTAAVLAGDLNSNPVLNRGTKRPRHSDLVQRLDALRLRSCYHEFREEAHGEESRPTHYHMWKPDRPFHLDYCFASEPLLERVSDVSVAHLDQTAKLSDHLPLVVNVREV